VSNSYEESVLLGALLDRLGKAQAQVLLARLDQWLSLENRGALLESIRSEAKQLDPVEGPHDRRKRDGNRIHNPDSNPASRTPKDRQS